VCFKTSDKITRNISHSTLRKEVKFTGNTHTSLSVCPPSTLGRYASVTALMMSSLELTSIDKTINFDKHIR
jgi:hypothetical protein